MDKQPHSRAPLIVAIVLLLLPVLYVGSYLAIVDPAAPELPVMTFTMKGFPRDHYPRIGRWAVRFYWPLEQIDRKLRPSAWEWGNSRQLGS